MKPSGDSSSSSGNNSNSNKNDKTNISDGGNIVGAQEGPATSTGTDKLFGTVANDTNSCNTGSSSTPLSTAPTSPLSQSSRSSYKSGACDYDATTPMAVYVKDGTRESGSGGGIFVLQMPDTGGDTMTLKPADDEPQLSERAAYGEQVVR